MQIAKDFTNYIKIKQIGSFTIQDADTFKTGFTDGMQYAIDLITKEVKSV